jgi:hypothetical protein
MLILTAAIGTLARLRKFALTGTAAEKDLYGMALAANTPANARQTPGKTILLQRLPVAAHAELELTKDTVEATASGLKTIGAMEAAALQAQPYLKAVACAERQQIHVPAPAIGEGGALAWAKASAILAISLAMLPAQLSGKSASQHATGAT